MIQSYGPTAAVRGQSRRSFAILVMAAALAVPAARTAAEEPGKSPKPLRNLFIAFRENCFGCGIDSTYGCEMTGYHPYLATEANIRTAFAPPADRVVLPLCAGQTFVPWYFRNSEDLSRRAEYHLEGMEKLGVRALSPSIVDFSLGVETMRRLAARTTVPFISTNLYDAGTGRPLFRPYLEFDYANASILVFGLTGPKLADNPCFPPSPPGVEVKDPREVLRATFRSLPEKPRLVIVLTSGIALEDQERIAEEFPQIHLFLGGEQFKDFENELPDRVVVKRKALHVYGGYHDHENRPGSKPGNTF
jgi:hypothetical protein